MFQYEDYKPVPNTMKVIMPTAPMRHWSIAFGADCNCWFNYKKLNFMRNPEEEIDFDHVKEQTDRIMAIIDEEIKQNLNGDSSKLFIGGFSQGAALAFYIAWEYPENFGGIILLSSHWLYSDPGTQIQESKRSIPIFTYHGTMDFKIPFKAANEYIKNLEEIGFNIEYHIEKKMGHTVSEEELEKFKTFMNKLTV